MYPAIKNIVSGNRILVFLALAFCIVCYIRRSSNLPLVTTSDVGGYYAYLPAVFVHHDVHKLPDKWFEGQRKNEKGEVHTKYTCGVAFFYLPFFLIAHGYAHITGTDASGYSPPYWLALMLCGVFWSIVGLYLLKTILLRHYGPLPTWLAVLAIALGTNFFNYASYENGMSHIYSFTLFAATLLAADTYYKRPSQKLAILLAVLLAWVVLIRPTNAVLGLFVLLYRITTWTALKERLRFYAQHFRHFLFALPIALLVFVPQLLYWKEMTGHWLNYSYAGEHFIYWANPQIIKVLCDTRNGLFIYSPTLVFAVWALIAWRKDPRQSLAGTVLVFCIITYTFASWWAYWFGGAYGHRCYVEFYTIFAFPVATTMEHTMQLRSKLAKGIILFFLAFFCYYTIYFSEMYLTVTQFGGSEWEWNFDTWIKYVRRIIGLPPIHPPGH